MSTYGGSVRIKCVAQAGQRSCTTACSLHILQQSPQVPSFLAYFEQNTKSIAWGISSSQAEVMEAIQQWLQGSSLDVLYASFDFIDRDKRKLLDIQRSVLSETPLLGSSLQIELKENREWSALWFRGETRAVMVDGSFTEAHFSWDQTSLFRWKVNDPTILATLIRSWISDDTAPSQMRIKFPWLVIGKLADYYERGNPVEGEFLQSWDDAERFIGNEQMQFPQRTAVFNLLEVFRKAGYDKIFRAGVPGKSLLLSRSRRHGLRADLKCIQFSFAAGEGTMDVFPNVTGAERIVGIPIALSKQVEQAVLQLADQPID